MNWDKLSMADRAKYIKLGLDNGITDLKIVKDTYNKYTESNLFFNGGAEDTFLGLTTDGWKDVGYGMMPIVGTVRDALTFYDNPTWANGIGLGVSALIDIAMLTGIGAAAKTLKPLYKAYKAKSAINTTRRLAYKEAREKAALARINASTGNTTSKEVLKSMQSLVAKKKNAEVAKLKAGLASSLYFNMLKLEAVNNTKKALNPIKYDTGVNMLLNYINTNDIHY